MILAQTYKNLIAFKSREGELIGFHTRNLGVASLTQSAEEFLFSKSDHPDVAAELDQWSEETLDLTSSQLKASIRNISINITQICNLHCTYCAAGGDGTYGAPQKKIDVAKTLPLLETLLNKTEGGVVHINFLGGEPLLYPQGIKLIVDYAREIAASKNIKLKFVVTTNGTLFNQEISEVLKAAQAFINVSLDGPPEINDIRRPMKNKTGSSSIAIENLNSFIEIRPQLGGIGLTSVFDSQYSDVYKTWSYFSTLASVDWFEFNFTHNEINSPASIQFSEGMAKIAQEAFEKGGEKELRRIKSFDHYFNLLDEQQRIENFCGAGKSLVVVDAKNNVYPCPWMVEDNNEKLNEGTALSKVKLNEYSQPLINKPPCHSCWAKFLCGGGCMFIHKTKTGHKDQVDTDFCSRTKNLIAISIIYYEKSRREDEVTHETY